MDPQYQLKTNPSGNENQGVHACKKCGWPFPKPHPSAKHRRAHKKICGPIEGYTHLTVSVDEQEHQSDEDSRTPSPKIEKRSIIESGGVGERSNRSEDEVFSDAVAEFLDSGFSPENEKVRLEGVNEMDKNLEGDLEGDMGGIESLKVDAIADSTEPLSSPIENNEVGSPKVLDGTITPFQDTRTEEVAIAAMNDSIHNSSLVKSKIPVDALGDILNENIGDNVKANKDEVDEFVKEKSDLPEINGKSKPANGCAESVLVLSVANDLPIVDHADTMLKDFKDHTTLKSEFPLFLGSADINRHLEDDDIGMVFEGSPFSIHSGRPVEIQDLSHQSEPVEHKEASDNSVQIKADPIQDTDSGRYGDMFEICDINGDTKETINVISVTKDSPIVNYADIMLDDFKDPKSFKSDFSPILGSADVINPLEGLNESGEVLESEGLEAPPSSSRIEKGDSNNRCEMVQVEEFVTYENESSEGLKRNEFSKNANMNFVSEDSYRTTKLTGGDDKDLEVSKEYSEKPIMKEPRSLPIHSEISSGNSTDVKDGGKGHFGVTSEPVQESDDKLLKKPGDISVDSSSQTDSVNGHWGSILENANLDWKIELERQDSDTADRFEAPSFLTLIDKKGVISEIETVVQTTEQPNTEALRAAWIPSLTNVVNESLGRKKNEEIIAKVTTWSTGKQHSSTPLKNLLGDAKVETKSKSTSPKQMETMVRKDDKDNGTTATSVKESSEVVKRKAAEEWDSPARYPVEIKKEKRKVKGRKPYWVPFACCSSSVH